MFLFGKSVSGHVIARNKKASTWEALVYSAIRNSKITACQLARQLDRCSSLESSLSDELSRLQGSLGRR